MIPKLHASKARNTVKLANYITNAEKAEEVFTSAALDKNDSLDEMARQINQECKACIEQAKGKRGRPPNPKKLIGHLTISFPPGEETTQEQRRDIVEGYMDEFGINGHQWIAAYHTDKPHKHLHVLFNRSSPTTHRPARMTHDRYRVMEVARRMEQKHNLTISPGKRDYTIEREKEIPAKAVALEAHRWETSFARWVIERKEPLAAIIDKARSWEHLHKGLADYGIEFQRRGNGLVISTMDTEEKANKSEFMKASDFGRQYSKPALEKKLGAFEPHIPIKSFNKSHQWHKYEKEPLVKSKEANQLYVEYEAAKERGEASTYKDFLMRLAGGDLEGDYLAIKLVQAHRNFLNLFTQSAPPPKPKPTLLRVLDARLGIDGQEPEYIICNAYSKKDRPFTNEPYGTHSFEEAKEILTTLDSKYKIYPGSEEEKEKIDRLFFPPKPAPEKKPEIAAAPTRDRGHDIDGGMEM